MSFAIISLSTFFIAALPFKNLSEKDLNSINRGNLVIRNIGSYKNISLDKNTSYASKIYSNIKDANPNYLMEVIQILPYEGHENLLANIKKTLVNVEDYAGIPYYSIRQQKTFDLYSSVKIKSKNVTGSSARILADIEMNPVGVVATDISISNSADELVYINTNTENIKYEGITCIKKEKMRTCIYVFRDNDKIILYGIGGVKAPTAFVKDRIETSFLGRIQSFCKYVFKKI